MNLIFKVIINNKRLIFPLVYLLLVITVSCCASLFSIDPNEINLDNALNPPSINHIFGTDDMGRDYFIRCVYGARISLAVGFFAMLTSLFIGTLFGLIAGYYGSIIDELVMRFIDFTSSIPPMILITVVGMFITKGVLSIILIIGMFSWMSIARIIRAEVLSIRERDFVKYSKYIGEKDIAVIIKHILPQVLPLIISAATIGIAGSIMAESALSYLGLGIVPPTSSWGSLINDSRDSFQKAPYMAIIPGVLIFCTVYSFKTLSTALHKLFSKEIK